MIDKIRLLFHTVRYLKCGQIWNRIKRKLVVFSVESSRASEVSRPSGIFQSAIPSQQNMFGENIFRFLNKTHVIKTARDWSDNQSKLWLYNLHYFNDLNAIKSGERKEQHNRLVQRWVEENKSGVGWEPYPSSLRIVNWIKWSLQGSDLKQDWLDSLATQTRYLNKNLEYHLMGNHLFSNAKALIFAGLYFKGSEAEEWYKTGIKIFNKELQEQVLPDGGNFELSPMYHAIFLEDLLDVVNIHYAFDKRFSHDVLGVISRMFDWLRVMSHPDGEVSFFNDSAIGIAPNLTELTGYAKRLNLKIPLPEKMKEVTYFQDSGYIQIHKKDLFALLDVANVGPSYIPGHAHADTLSFELSLFDKRVVVNSGISCYGNSSERLRQRGTQAHNTVVIDGENSSEVWSGFRVARRAKPFNLNITETDDLMRVSCSHDGYKRLSGRPVHTRTWLARFNQLVVDDVVVGKFRQAEAHYHFHPNVKVDLDATESKGIIYLEGDNKVYFDVQSGFAKLVDSTYHPGFGVSENNKCLVVGFESNQSTLRFFW